jgi:hypothetical protein
MKISSQNILKVYKQATPQEILDGMSWYERAHDSAVELSNKHGMPLDAVAGVIAALSPQTSWERNLFDADRLLAAFVRSAKSASQTKISSYKSNRRKAVRIMKAKSGENGFSLTTGPKTWNFYRNILNPTNNEFCTIDRFAYGVASGRTLRTIDDIDLTAKRYRDTVKAYQDAARSVGILPHQMQAVCWVAIHRINREK